MVLLHVSCIDVALLLLLNSCEISWCEKKHAPSKLGIHNCTFQAQAEDVYRLWTSIMRPTRRPQRVSSRKPLQPRPSGLSPNLPMAHCASSSHHEGGGALPGRHSVLNLAGVLPCKTALLFRPVAKRGQYPRIPIPIPRLQGKHEATVMLHDERPRSSPAFFEDWGSPSDPLL